MPKKELAYPRAPVNYESLREDSVDPQEDSSGMVTGQRPLHTTIRHRHPKTSRGATLLWTRAC